MMKKLCIRLMPLFMVLLISVTAKSATFNFNTLYKGTGSSYGTNSQNIAGLISIAGSGFQFYQAGAQFSGNSINGTLTYYDVNNNLVTIYGNLNRQDKTGSVSNSFYLTVFTDATYTTATGEAFLLVVPGKESTCSAGATISTSSDPMANALNAVVNAMPVVTLNSTGNITAFTACTGTPSGTQSFTISANNLTNNVNVTAPTGFVVSNTQAGTYSSSMSITGATLTNSPVWVKLSSSSAGTYSGTISVVSTGAGSQYVSVTGTVNNVSGGTISGSTTVSSATNTTTLTLSGYVGTIQWESSTNNTTFTAISGATSATYTATNVAATTYYRAVVTAGSCVANSNTASIIFDSGCYTFTSQDFILNGNGVVLSDNASVRLTEAIGNQNGSIWNRSRVNLDYDFDISTSINLGANNFGADGIAFVLQNLSVNAGSAGGGLGYAGITPSFAVEFDTYFNGGNDPGSGADHIAIIKNGSASSIPAHSEFATPYQVEMEDGLWHDVRFVWTAATKNFKVYWDGSNTPLFNITQDLKANIFSNSNNVYFGFTAATGGAVNIQQIRMPNYCMVKEVSITPKPGYLNSAAATSFCAPAAVQLEASLSSSYQWYKDGVAMQDSTSRSIIVTSGGVYKVAAVDTRGNNSVSTNLTVTVGSVLLPGTITGNENIVCSGTNSTTLTLTGATGNIQWQRSTNGTTFTNITGATSATYTATNITANTYFRNLATSGTCSVNSDTVSIRVNPISVGGTISGGNISLCSGSSNNTILTLSGYTGTIQWQSSTNNSSFTDINGATSATYTATDVTSTTYYRAVVTSGVCSSANSASVAITISQCLVANPDINATNVNTPVSGSVNTNDKTTAGTTYGSPIPSNSNPTGATFTLNADGTYTFTSPKPGRYIYYISVCAAGQTTGCAVSTLEISVTDPNSTNNPPIAKNDYATSLLNTPVAVKILSNDKVANPNTALLPSSITIVAAPNNGTATVNSAGVLTFVPNSGFTGTDSLNYNVCDNASPANCQIATVYFKISNNSVAEFTTADDDFNKVDMNSVATGNVLTNDLNSANNNLTVTSFVAPLASQGVVSIAADGSYTFTPTANYYGPVNITYTACTSGSVCATATLHILVSPVKPAAPKANGGTYTSKDPSNPITIGGTVTNVPAGSKVIYCDVNGLNCANTAPSLPTAPGKYIWCVKSQDTITNLTSTPCVYDTITILPYVKVINATYVKGVSTNPTTIASLITEIPTGSIPKWCNIDGTNCTTTAPNLPTTVGKTIWCVKAVDVASGLESAVCKMDTVTIIDPYSVVEISKTAKSVKQNPDGTILVTFMMYAINKTDASIDSVSIKDDLTKTFNTSTGVVAYSLETFGGLVKNIGYDGIANIEMLDPSSKVAAKKTDSLILKVLLESPSISGTLYNQATLTGKTKYGKVSVISNDPFANPTDSTKRVPTSFVIPKIDVIVAGGFSPNQDGMNDKWIIIRPYGTKIQAKVFNRWGNLVYENDNYQNDWDGRGQGNFMGNFLPEGTYFYLVEAIDRNGNTQKFSKTLTIVR